MKRWVFCIISCCALSSGAGAVAAEPNPATPGYKLPAPDLVKLADAPLPLVAVPSPDASWVLFVEQPALLPLETVAQPELKLAGLRFNPERHSPSRESYAFAAHFQKLPKQESHAIGGLPPGAELRRWQWSPDGTRVAFAVTTARDVELWVAERQTGAARRLGDVALNGVHPEQQCYWLPDSKGLVCRVVPRDLGPPPPEPRVPAGPITDENTGKKSPARTVQDLIKDEHGADVFAYMLRAEVVRIDLDGTVTPILPADMIVRAEPSPDGKYLLVETVKRPFSYLVPEERFPRRFEIRAIAGQPVKVIADVPLADQVPIDFSAVRTGRRELEWRADAPATLAFAEAQDGGDPHREAKIRDKVYVLPAPFTAAPVELAQLSLRYASVWWGRDDLAIVTESWWKDRKLREWRVQPGMPKNSQQLIAERSSEDRYADPGRPLMRQLPSGHTAMRLDGDTLYRAGDGASPGGVFPFLDAYTPAGLDPAHAARKFHCAAPFFERPIALLPDGRLFLARESADDMINYFVRDLPSGKLERVSDVPNPYAALKGTKKELIKYPRKDGLQLTGTLYLPPGYKPGTRLPVLLWAYPQEFKSAAAAGQVRESPFRYPRLYGGSPLYWLTRGFAVLDNPAFPIVGEGKAEPNDSYVEQLVADAQAAVDELVKRGVGDRERMAIGGHSYGAFTTANLLAHSRLFRAGIARSGAYNRTLTPFGFQSEERTFWEAKDTYLAMSPFTYAGQIDDALLMIHGAEDNNEGTYPIQSERLFAALKGMGKTARLVMLPKEAHGYRARESILHMIYEMDRWLDKYVKHAAPRAAAHAATAKSN